ncbi:hypothetical protein [Vitiosangium sp. GDMCC 1.1324]|uniref:hypothetical protein n=1 Tax=Vitiosangium sp. (strain GDMCC 1.1324) TaxID=2138576 RepID=UPI000D3B57F3|nr:hypothetical protein [Vitiosangium sp. GDMCC 1.1324]PTL76783.1 hypothetical protein DAT35_48545 [Vitiosangium sp. GDMCC 1.1324]
MSHNPNDQRSDVKNPNNPAHKQDRDNRSNQKNPNHPAHPSRQADTGGSSPGGPVPGSSPSNTKR